MGSHTFTSYGSPAYEKGGDGEGQRRGGEAIVGLCGSVVRRCLLCRTARAPGLPRLRVPSNILPWDGMNLFAPLDALRQQLYYTHAYY